MASSAGQKPLILTAAEADLKRADARAEASARLAERQANLPGRGSDSAIAYAVAALILLAAGYIWFSGNSNTMMLFPTVSETVPSPDIKPNIAPVPLAPPPADAPATNP